MTAGVNIVALGVEGEGVSEIDIRQRGGDGQHTQNSQDGDGHRHGTASGIKAILQISQKAENGHVAKAGGGGVGDHGHHPAGQMALAYPAYDVCNQGEHGKEKEHAEIRGAAMFFTLLSQATSRDDQDKDQAQDVKGDAELREQNVGHTFHLVSIDFRLI